MTRAELVDHYLEKKINGEYDFSEIKKELKEKHQISSAELSEIVDIIANAELNHKKSDSKKSFGFALFIISLGIIAVIYSVYGIMNSFKPEGEQMSTMSKSLNYLCLLGGVYIILRNLKKLKA